MGVGKWGNHLHAQQTQQPRRGDGLRAEQPLEVDERGGEGRNFGGISNTPSGGLSVVQKIQYSGMSAASA